MLRLSERAYLEIVGYAYDCLPDEACGLLGGPRGGGRVQQFVPCINTDASSRTYEPDFRCWGRADDVLEPVGHEVVGIMHSHTHTEAYPSPTDVEKANPDFPPWWHYVIVSLREPEPVLRSFRIHDGRIAEEPVELVGG